MPFADDLRVYGPDADYLTPSIAEARSYCARLAADHYENFTVVGALTPRELRPAFRAVYAFCRWSDDLGDEVGDPGRSRELLAWWREQLQACYEGRTHHPVFVALSEVIRDYRVPIGPFADLISAFETDQEVVQYETYEQLVGYCTQSADPVGRIVLRLGHAYDDSNAALSDRTCTALQLANHWQDVSRDLAIGRVYLPLEDRERFGVRIEDLRARRITPEFREMMAFQVERTRNLFHEGRPLVERLPRSLAPAVDLFTRGGLAILAKIEAAGFDVLTSRPALTKFAKLGLVARAVAGRYGRAGSRKPRRVPTVAVAEPEGSS